MNAYNRWLLTPGEATYDEFRQREWDSRRALRQQRVAAAAFFASFGVDNTSLAGRLVQQYYQEQQRPIEAFRASRGLGSLVGGLFAGW